MTKNGCNLILPKIVVSPFLTDTMYLFKNKVVKLKKYQKIRQIIALTVSNDCS